MIRTFRSWLRRRTERFRPPRRLIVVVGDSLPARMPKRDLVLADDDGEPWCVGMICPCGCGRTIELLLIAEAKPRWSIKLDVTGLPTLAPSVWLRTGCQSHFWVRNGRVEWCLPAADRSQA